MALTTFIAGNFFVERSYGDAELRSLVLPPQDARRPFACVHTPLPDLEIETVRTAMAKC